MDWQPFAVLAIIFAFVLLVAAVVGWVAYVFAARRADVAEDDLVKARQALVEAVKELCEARAFRAAQGLTENEAADLASHRFSELDRRAREG